jgi:hypothetical protein
MNAQVLTPGTMHGEDFFAGRIMVNGTVKGILLPPKKIRQFPKSVIYNDGAVEGATSWFDGLQNTKDMAAAGSELAKWALEQGLHIPSLDELEIIYRACKPTKDPNAQWGRSGVNVSAVPPTYPYTRENPLQTTDSAFQEGGEEAFDTNDWYWSSTRRPAYEGHAFARHFKDGDQSGFSVGIKCLACAVRWIDI